MVVRGYFRFPEIGQLEADRRQRVEQRALVAFEDDPAGVLPLLERPGVDLLDEVEDRLVQFGEADETPVTQDRPDVVGDEANASFRDRFGPTRRLRPIGGLSNDGFG